MIAYNIWNELKFYKVHGMQRDSDPRKLESPYFKHFRPPLRNSESFTHSYTSLPHPWCDITF